LPDESDVVSYEENGYYVSKEGVVPEALIDAAWEGTQRFYGARGMAPSRSTAAFRTGRPPMATARGTTSSYHCRRGS